MICALSREPKRTQGYLSYEKNGSRVTMKDKL